MFKKTIRLFLFLGLLFIFCACNKAILEPVSTESTVEKEFTEDFVEEVNFCDPTDIYIASFIRYYNQTIHKSNGRINKNLISSLAKRRGNTIIFELSVPQELTDETKEIVYKTMKQSINPCEEFFVVLPDVNFSIIVYGKTLEFSCAEE